MYTYIKQSVSGFYVELPEKLTSDLYSNLGKTYKDFEQDKWVLLSNKQVQFHKDNPDATIQEVWSMQLNKAPERTLGDAKHDKIKEIEEYDKSSEVNSFTINNSIHAWFTVQERLNYKQSIEAAKLLGVDKLTFFVGDTMLSVSTTKAEQMLAALQLYADQCFIVTKQHKLAVETLDTIEAVDSYDFTVGYPEQFNFNLED